MGTTAPPVTRELGAQAPSPHERGDSESSQNWANCMGRDLNFRSAGASNLIP